MLKYLWPEYYAYRPYAPYHLDILTREKTAWIDRRGCGYRTLRALAAPRSTSKTGILRGDLCHDILFGLEALIAIFSVSLANSIQTLARVRKMLLSKRVAAVFGAITITGGALRYTVTTADGHKCTMVAKSFGTDVRGLDDDTRPTRIAIDDGESKLKVAKAENREKQWLFLVEDILKLGDIGGGLIVDFVGTVLHADSILARLLQSSGKGAGWSAWRYQACISPPVNKRLWEECRLVWSDLSLSTPWVEVARQEHVMIDGVPFDDIPKIDRRRAAAQAFYRAHKEAMDEGAVMLAEPWINLFQYQETIWAEGITSVLKELQNDPRNAETALFNLDDESAPGLIRRCRFDGRYIHTSRGTVVPIAACKVAIWLDHSGGKAKSDYPAIAVVAKDPDGWRYWIRCDLTRRQPSAQHAALWTVWEHFAALNPSVGVDATGTQGLLGEAMDRQTKDRRAAGKPWNMDLREYTYSKRGGSAATLIEEWESVLSGGFLEVAEDLPDQVLSQIRDFPGAAHDDALAAAERADWLLMGAPEVAPTVRDAVRTLGWLSGGR